MQNLINNMVCVERLYIDIMLQQNEIEAWVSNSHHDNIELFSSEIIAK